MLLTASKIDLADLDHGRSCPDRSHSVSMEAILFVLQVLSS